MPLADARRLRKPRERRQSGRFLAEGPHVIEAALMAGATIVEAFSSAALLNAAASATVERLGAAGVRVREVGPRALREIADTATPQGVVAVVGEPAWEDAAFTAPGVHLVLAGLQDPGNAGTLVRSAEVLGARSVLGLPGTTDLFGARAVRAGQGAQVLLPVTQGERADRLLAELRGAGGAVWTADAAGENVFATSPPPRLALVVGGEAQGVPEGLRAAAERAVAVPQRGRGESLNAALAGAVLLAWLARDPAG